MKKSVLLALTICVVPCAKLSAMEQPTQDQDSSIALFDKYLDSNKKTVDYSDLHKLRTIFETSYPDELSIFDLQKRLVACCTLQELRKVEGCSYSDDRQTLQTKIISLFPGKTENDVEVRSALMYLLPEKGTLTTEMDYSNYLSQLIQDIKSVTTKQQQLKSLAQKQPDHTEAKISIQIHQLAHKLLNKRLEDTQCEFTSWIESLECDIQDMENDQQSQKSAELKEFKARLHNAKHILAQSKGEASFLQNWITGY